MALCNLIPRELSIVPPPLCPGCAYGKAYRKQWRYKGTKNLRHIHKAEKSGNLISVDQLVSPTKYLFPIHCRLPTTKGYIESPIFVDHHSDFIYVYFMTEMNVETTVEAKDDFERLLYSHEVFIKHYYTNNGYFDTKVFKQSLSTSKQTLSFCGVNAYHQNRKTEKIIKDITTGVRTQLLHAAHRWPAVNDESLWQVALKNYVNLRNQIPTYHQPGKKEGKKYFDGEYVESPLSRLSGEKKELNIKNIRSFGCSVYVLEIKLQALRSHNKWSDRYRVGIYLCQSPNHSTDVSLVLNTTTANMSPQFHCIYDDDLSTCKRDAKFKIL